MIILFFHQLEVLMWSSFHGEPEGGKNKNLFTLSLSNWLCQLSPDLVQRRWENFCVTFTSWVVGWEEPRGALGVRSQRQAWFCFSKHTVAMLRDDLRRTFTSLPAPPFFEMIDWQSLGVINCHVSSVSNWIVSQCSPLSPSKENVLPTHFFLRNSGPPPLL
jgi:hypothetical protein